MSSYSSLCTHQYLHALRSRLAQAQDQNSFGIDEADVLRAVELRALDEPAPRPSPPFAASFWLIGNKRHLKLVSFHGRASVGSATRGLRIAEPSVSSKQIKHSAIYVARSNLKRLHS